MLSQCAYLLLSTSLVKTVHQDRMKLDVMIEMIKSDRWLLTETCNGTMTLEIRKWDTDIYYKT